MTTKNKGYKITKKGKKLFIIFKVDVMGFQRTKNDKVERIILYSSTIDKPNKEDTELISLKPHLEELLRRACGSKNIKNYSNTKQLKDELEKLKKSGFKEYCHVFEKYLIIVTNLSSGLIEIYDYETWEDEDMSEKYNFVPAWEELQ